MKPLLVSLILLLGQQSARPSVGTISGQLRDIFGVPAKRVRVAAVSVVAGVQAATVGRITETDSEGRFRLEGVPPGGYLIMAGPLDTPNYFPGVTAQDQGRTVTIAGGQTITGLDFMISPARAVNDPNGGFALPISVSVDDGGQLRSLSKAGIADRFTGVPVIGAGITIKLNRGQ